MLAPPSEVVRKQEKAKNERYIIVWICDGAVLVDVCALSGAFERFGKSSHYNLVESSCEE